MVEEAPQIILDDLEIEAEPMRMIWSQSRREWIPACLFLAKSKPIVSGEDLTPAEAMLVADTIAKPTDLL
jgi:hypothetical protein